MRRTLFALLLLNFALHAPVLAQEDDPPKVEKEKFKPTDIVTRPVEMILAPVIGKELSSVKYLENDASEKVETVIIATTPQKEFPVDFPGFVTVITRKDIESSNARYVYELLRREPGIYVRDFTGSGKTVAVDMRGFGETAHQNTLVLLDGRRLNEIDLSGTDWSQIPIENVERIEIVRGGGAVIYGDNASAGVINIISRRGKKGFYVFGGAEFGDYKYRSFNAGMYGGTDRIAYNALYKHATTDGYRVNGGILSDDLQGAMSFYTSDNFTLDVSGGWHRDWYGMPGALTRSDVDQVGRRGAKAPNDGAKTETAYFQIDNGIFFDNDWFFEKECAFYTNFWGRKRRTNTNWWWDFFGWAEQRDVSHIHSYGLSQKFVVSNEWDFLRSRQTWGYDWFSAQNRIMSHTPAWASYTELKIRKDSLGMFWNQRLDLWERIIGNMGLRQEWAWYTFDQSSAGSYESKKPEKTVFDVGIEYKYLTRGAVYGRFSRGFRFPATDEFYSSWSGLNAGLSPQTSDTWELGIEDKNWKYLMPSVNFFWMKTKSEIFYDPYSFRNSNYAQVNRLGIETSVNSVPFDWLEGYVTYTWLDAKFSKDDFKGNRVPMVPENKMTLGANWRILEQDLVSMFLNYNAEAIGSQFPISDQKNILPKNKGYFVNNLKATLKCGGLTLFFACNNIFDVKYSEYSVSNTAGTVDNYYPASGRSFHTGISAKF
jgi:iron complex outermembrane recepter protein